MIGTEPIPEDFDTDEEYQEAQDAWDIICDQAYEEYREEKRGVTAEIERLDEEEKSGQ